MLLNGIAVELRRLAEGLAAAPCSDGLPVADAIEDRSPYNLGGLVDDRLDVFGKAWNAAIRGEADLWLTREVVLARSRAKGGASPARPRPADACDGWAVASGGAAVRFSGELPAPSGDPGDRDPLAQDVIARP